MVNPATVSTYADWDLVSETPRRRSIEHAVSRGTETPGAPILASSIAPRGYRSWTTTIRIAKPSEIARLTQIQINTRNGILPVRFTPPPPEDVEGPLPVLFDAEQFGFILSSARVGSFEVTVTEFV